MVRNCRVDGAVCAVGSSHAKLDEHWGGEAVNSRSLVYVGKGIIASPEVENAVGV